MFIISNIHYHFLEKGFKLLKDVSTRKKLLILPIIFICIFILSASVFSYFHNLSEKKEMVVSQTDLFIQQVLKGRISVYQFLRVASEDSAKNVKEDFKELDKSVKFLIPNLSTQKDINTANDIVDLGQKYVSNFVNFSSKRIVEFNNGNLKESPEILATIKSMVKIVNAKWGTFMLSNIYYDLGFKAFINYNKIDALKMTFDFIDLLSDLI